MTVENIISAIINNTDTDLENAIKQHIKSISHRFVTPPNVDYCTKSAMLFIKEWKNRTMNPVICGSWRNFQEVSFNDWFIKRETFLDVFEKTYLYEYYFCTTKDRDALIARINKRIVRAIMEASTGVCGGGIGAPFIVHWNGKSHFNCGCTVGKLKYSSSTAEFISRHVGNGGAKADAKMMLFFCKKIHPKIYFQLMK